MRRERDQESLRVPGLNTKAHTEDVWRGESGGKRLEEAEGELGEWN